ncbi:MAG TPA: LPS export ABC transporter periplasmic protein LptC [Steroidobacteraceae bacterium]|jgi:LPS export ABC transporter protein LptC
MLFRLFTIIAVAALGIFTWILTSPAHRQRLESDNSHGSLPGYFLKNAVMTDYDAQGNPAVRIEAERIDQVVNSDQVALYNVKVDYQPPSGESWTMVGDSAHLTPGDKVVNVQGNVKLTGDALGREGDVPVVRTDSLSYNIPEGIVSTQADVRLEFGPHVLMARGLVANLKDQTMRLENKVNGRFHP